MMRRPAMTALAVVVLLGGCESPAGVETTDEGVFTDTTEDTSDPDTATPDTATPDTATPDTSTQDAVGSRTFQVEVWADNWFSFSLGESFIFEDSVSITTEKSFNAETFTFDGAYPLVLNFVVKDFKQDDSGLEYIGAPNQQMGDGGFIAQVTDVDSGDTVAVTDASWRCLVIHKAPLDKGCEKSANPSQDCEATILDEPQGWKAAGFDTAGWETATEYTAAQVGPKDGYTQITWDAAARLVWTSDLEQDNTLLCKLEVPAP